MWYPVLNAKQKQQTMIDTFGGYNHTARPAEAEFYDMQNMSGDDFPLLSTRGKRGILPVTDEYVGHMAKDGKLLCLKESGTETLKLTVKDAIEAAELPEVPEEITIEPPKNYLDVYSVKDLSGYRGSVHFYDGSYNINDAIKYGYYNLTGIINAEQIDDEQWRIWLNERFSASINAYSLGFIYPNHTARVNTFQVSNDYVIGDLVTDLSEDFLSAITEAGGSTKIGFDGRFYFDKYQNGEKIQEIKYSNFHYVRFEITGYNNDGHTVFRIPIRDFFGAGMPSYDTQCTYQIREGVNEGNRYIYYPVIYTEDSCSYSYDAYQSQLAEANAQHILDLEAYEESKKTQITLNETLTEEVAERIKDRTVQIGEDEYYIQNATAGKSGEGNIQIAKPHGAIEAGTQVDTGAPYLSLCEINPQTGAVTSAPIGLTKAEGERTMLSMGAKVVVFPDKIEVNTMEKKTDGAYTDYGPLELSSDLRCNTQHANLSVLIALCDAQYQYIGTPTVSKTAPSSPSNGQYWLDNSKSDVHLKVYSTATKMWTEVETYLKIYSVDLNVGLEAGDAVRIMDGAKPWSHDSVSFSDDGDSHIIYAAGEEALPGSLSGTYGHMTRRYIVVRGILKDVGTDGTVTPAQEDGVCMTIRRTVPDLDYIVESGNRLWGCHYGKNADGESVNEIYACKQGDPKNWFSYEGTAMDSYAASIGTDGPFTGAAVYAGNPVFFKENYMHRIYGNYPANYQILTQAVHGVQQGCAQSLAVVNERLFYKAQDGIYAYDGSLPYLMSEAFGSQAYTRAIGADGGGKYFVSLEKPDGTRDLMAYDLQKRMWYREDDMPVRYLIPLGQALIAVTRDRQMIDLLGRHGEAEPDFEWYAESGNIGYAIAAKKFVGRMLLRMDLSDGAYVRVQIAYDNYRVYTDLFTSSESGIGTIHVPIRPHRCDHFRVRICGKGAVKLISVTKTIKGGSDK